MKKGWLLIFAIALILFSIFSTKISFHDTHEFIAIAKYFAGVENIDLFIGHSILYPFIMSFFLKIWPTFTAIKLFNSLFVFLMGLVILNGFKSKKTFLLFAFSPLTWYISIQTTPVLPASLFFLLSYLFYLKKDFKYSQLISGLFLGISIAFYTPMLIIYVLFALVHFWKKSFSEFFIWSIAVVIGIIPRFLLDFYLFNNPLYTFIRYAGANLVVTLGLHSITRNIQPFVTPEVFLIFIAMSPLLYKIIKIDWKRYAPHLIFLILTSIVWFIRGAKIKYFLIISPLILLFLGKTLRKKDMQIHIILSIIITIFLVSGFFGAGENVQITNDLNQIQNDFQPDLIIGAPFQSVKLAAHTWENSPYFIWDQDYKASLENKQSMRSYQLTLGSKIPLREKIQIAVDFNRFEDKKYTNFIYVYPISHEPPEQYSTKNCYQQLCAYGN